ncbi:MAG: glycosyltransferase, partial [Planctomycetota bacterium]
MPPTVTVWGTAFARLDMDGATELADRIIDHRQPEYFITANLNYLMLTHQVPRLEEINSRAAAVLADGFPIVVRSRLSSRPLPGRVTGADLIVRLAELAHRRRYSIYFLGGAAGVAAAAAKKLNAQYPHFRIAGCASPALHGMSAAEHQRLVDEIRQSRPDILLVAFGQPKGECWIYDHLRDLNVPLSMQIGASFDFLVGTARRAPQIWQDLGAEWLYRMLSEPRRLGPRYARNMLHLGQLVAGEMPRAVSSLLTS